jgi:hypothetical protein
MKQDAAIECQSKVVKIRDALTARISETCKSQIKDSNDSLEEVEGDGKDYRGSQSETVNGLVC